MDRSPHIYSRPATRLLSVFSLALLLVLFTCFSVAQAEPQVEDNGSSPSSLINGTTVDTAGEWPWIVALIRSHDPALKRAFCGGSLIAPDRVLTAAHCVLDLGPSDINVVIGRNRLGDRANGKVASVMKITMHPRALTSGPRSLPNDGSQNDVALLKLSRPVDIQPVELATPGEESRWAAGQIGTLLGYGIFSEHRDGYSEVDNQLRQGNTEIISNQTCALLNESSLSDLASMICTRSSENAVTRTCSGDSGGPLLVGDHREGYVQIGVVSWGNQLMCDEGSLNVFADVSALHPFITQPNSNLVAKPLNTTLPKVVGSTIVGHTLSCTPGTWSGDPSISFSYQWYRVEEQPPPYSLYEEPVPGATTPTYKIKAEDIGKKMSCRVIARNEGGFDLQTGYSDSKIKPKIQISK